MKRLSLLAIATLFLMACSSAAPTAVVDVSNGKSTLAAPSIEETVSSQQLPVTHAADTEAEAPLLVAVEAPRAEPAPASAPRRSATASAAPRQAPAASPAPSPEPAPTAEPPREATPEAVSRPAIEPTLLAAAARAARSALSIAAPAAPPTATASVRPTPSTSSPSEQSDHAPATTSEVYRAVERLPGLQGWTVIPFAHFTRGERHAVVAWPAMSSSGQLRDATVVGICLEETPSGELEECGRRWVVTDRARSRAALSNALGGSDYRAAGRGSGAALDDLGPELGRRGTAFARAARARNGNAARQAALSFARLLPLDRVAYDNDVAELLYLGANYDGTLRHVRTEARGDTATLTFHVMRGPFRMQTITATARPVSAGSDRWIVVSYR